MKTTENEFNWIDLVGACEAKSKTEDLFAKVSSLVNEELFKGGRLVGIAGVENGKISESEARALCTFVGETGELDDHPNLGYAFLGEESPGEDVIRNAFPGAEDNDDHWSRWLGLLAQDEAPVLFELAFVKGFLWGVCERFDDGKNLSHHPFSGFTPAPGIKTTRTIVPGVVTLDVFMDDVELPQSDSATSREFWADQDENSQEAVRLVEQAKKKMADKCKLPASPTELITF